MNICQGDRYIPLRVTLILDDLPFVLQETDELILTWSVNGIKTEVTPEIVNANTGELQYVFQAGDTDIAGRYRGQITVIRDGKSISFPDNGSFFRWVVHPRL